MEQQTRNHSVAGVALLGGAAMIALGATRPWVTGDEPLLGAASGDALGFDQLLGPGGRFGNVEPLLLGGAAVLGVSAALLFLTQVPVLGVLWRLPALATAVGLGLTSAAVWRVVNDPTSVMTDPGTPAGQVLGLGASIEPGLGLWLLTIGSVLAAVGTLIPARRSRTLVPEAPAPSGLRRAPVGDRLWPGWYPDQLDRGLVRFFDGRQWTAATRPRS
jgi:hypothetical protein